ncbi:MAG: DNA repair protein RadC [Sphingobium sp.]|nr:DNA repair protein RadC [Sphingobium sp.]
MLACRELLFHALRERIDERPILGTPRDLRDYLTLVMGYLPVEEFRVLFLANGYRLIADEPMWRGTVDQVPAYPREIVGRALHFGAKSVIIVHNHPSGSAQPSTMDEAVTENIHHACLALGIDLLDHLIITSRGIASFRELGLL